ncbi:MAG: DEAD/DEAH box helicase [Anaerolineae bacterium]|nr:DEAD/DEAH box helicase [Anaerolineae bacterium]
MITSRLVKKFLAQPRRDLRPLKKWTNKQLDEWFELNGFTGRETRLWKGMRLHQKVLFMVTCSMSGRLGVFADTGTGKTYLTCSLVTHFFNDHKLDHALVLVPNKVNKSEWEREITKHVRGLPHVILRGSSDDKWVQLNNLDACKGLIIVETYGGLTHLLCKEVTPKKGKKKTKGGKNKVKFIPDMKKIRKMQSIVNGLFMDESTTVGNKKSLYFRLCRQLVKKCHVRIALTGTPFGRDPMLLWSQMFLIDGGETLGTTQTMFRGAFYESNFNGFGMDHKFIKAKMPLLNTILANRSLRYKADAADLPDVVPIKKVVTLSEEAGSYADRAKKTLRQACGEYQVTKNMFLRLRQVSSGFIGFSDDETGDKAEVEFAENPKLEMLMSIIESVADEHKVVVHHEFNYSGMMIERELKRLKIGHIRLWGGTRDPDEALRVFDNDDDCRVMALSNAAGGFGLNLQQANYAIYFESPVGVILRRQTERRTERQFSRHKRVFRYDLIAEGTADESIRRFHKEGEDLFKAIIEGKVVL